MLVEKKCSGGGGGLRGFLLVRHEQEQLESMRGVIIHAVFGEYEESLLAFGVK